MAEGGLPLPPSKSSNAEGLRDCLNVCQLCGTLENLSLCGGCKGTWYCSKEHQVQDWKKHKKGCKKGKNSSTKSGVKSDGENNNNNNNNVNASKKTTNSSSVAVDPGLHFSEPETSKATKMPNEVTDDCFTDEDGDSNQDSNSSELGSDLIQNKRNRCFKKNIQFSENDSDNTKICNGNRKKKLSTSQSATSVNKQSNNCDRENVNKDEHTAKLHVRSKYKLSKLKLQEDIPGLPAISEDGLERYYLNSKTHTLNLPTSVKEAVSKQIQDQNKEQGDQILSPTHYREQYLSILNHRFEALAEYVVTCLTKHGICVIDNFLGEATGRDILKEVKTFETAGVMKQGQLVQGTSSSSTNKYIRGDIITWVDGTDSKSENIHYLISCMDAVMIQSATKLQPYTINERTKVCLQYS